MLRLVMLMTVNRWTLRVAWSFTLLIAGTSCSGSATNSTAPPTNSSGLASCADEVDHTASQCPALVTSRTFSIAECERMRNQFEPMGCGPEFAAYVRCVSAATIHCDTGEPVGCSDEKAGDSQRQSAFVAPTSC